MAKQLRVYVAGPWDCRNAAREVAELLEKECKVIITRDWWNHEAGEHDTKALAKLAREDVNAVREADVMVLLNFAKSEGKAVEQGIAIAEGIPIFALNGQGSVVGASIFHHLGAYTWFSTLAHLMKGLDTYASEIL